MTLETCVFRARGVSVSYGGVRALDGVDLAVDEGQLVGLIGPNGAGKTTFIDAVTGFAPSQGTVEIDGEVISGLPAHKRARRGLARTWQSIELFDDLSLEKNLVVAARQPTVAGTAREVFTGPPALAEVAEVLGLVGLASRRQAMPDTLSLGQRKLAGVARALVGRPRMLCLDEPAAGLDRAESGALGRQLRKLADDGQSMLLIDHDMSLVLAICDHIVVLNFGEVIATGPPKEVVRDANVLSAYLGSAAGPAVDAVDTELAGDQP